MRIQRKRKGFYVRAEEKIPCPHCGGKLKPKGWPKRGSIQVDGEKWTLKVQRRRCEGCGKYHRELPDFIVPYKRHCLETIELIITGQEAITYTELETPRRIREWWSKMVVYIAVALAAIKEKYGIDLTHLAPVANLAKIVRALANTNLWPGTRSALDAVP